MRRIIALICCGFLTACARQRPIDLFVDQRGVTTEPAERGEKNADAIVRVEEFQLAPPKQQTPNSVLKVTIPPSARPIASLETLITFDTPFYCTFAQPKSLRDRRHGAWQA